MNKLIILVPLSLVSMITVAVPKKMHKIAAAKAANVRVSPTSPNANIIANNTGDGVLITNNSNGNIVQDNAIGTNLSGLLSMGNGGAGVHINVNSSNNIVGNTNISLGNYIANNHKGVIVGDSATDLSVGNTIINNSIYSNTLPGIDLANDGPTPNHPTSPTSGPNHFQNYPVLTSYTLTGTGLTISWTLNSVASSTFLLQFFTNNVGDPEGKRVITNATVTTDATGFASGTVAVGTVPLNTPLTATATLVVSGVNTDTSEFSTPLTYGVATPCPITCNNK